MANENLETYFQLKLETALENFKLQDTDFSVPGNVTNKELDNMVIDLLKSKGLNILENETGTFDFFIKQNLLNIELAKFCQIHTIENESNILVEYKLKSRPYELNDSTQFDNWIKYIDVSNENVLISCDNSNIYLQQPNKTTFNFKNTNYCKNGPVKFLKKNPESFLCCGKNFNIQKFNIKTDEEPKFISEYKYIGHEKFVESLDISKNDDYFVSGSSDCYVKVWKVYPESSINDKPSKETKKLSAPLVTFSGHLNKITKVLANENNVLSSSWDGTIKYWNISEEKQEFTLSYQHVAFFDMSLNIDSKSLLVCHEKTVKLWDIRNKEIVQNYKDIHKSIISQLAWSETSSTEYFFATFDNMILHYDIRNGKNPLNTIKVGSNIGKLFSLHLNQNMIYCGGTDSILYTFSQ